MTYLAGSLAAVFFLVAFGRLRVTEVATRAISSTSAAARSIGDASLSDSEKERRMRAASLSLSRDFLSITARGLGALGASLLPPLGFDLLGLASFSSVMSWLATWEAIALLSVLVTIWYLGIRFR